MDISVIIPVYNSEKTIERCITSVNDAFEGLGLEYEIICVNDGSQDQSLSIMREMQKDQRNLVVLTQKNKGVSAARNAGLDKAAGRFIAFNDSDDEWEKDHISALCGVFSAHPEVSCAAGNHEVDRQPVFMLKEYGGENLYSVSLNAQLFKGRFSPPNSMIRAEALSGDKGVLRFNESLRGAEDFDFFNSIIKDHTCVLLNKKLGKNILHKARWGEGGLSGNLKVMEKGELFAIKRARKELGVGGAVFLAAYCFSVAKYIRRVILTFVRRRRAS